jgi:hypothetical protein
MFIDNKYTKIYYKIIEQAKQNVNLAYSEKHHIIPKSLGGNDSKSNIAVLTAKQHFLCHRLLVKMTEGSNRLKMLRAFVLMSGKKIYNSKQYQKLREEYSVYRKFSVTGSKNPMYGVSRKGKSNPMYGKNHTEETKVKISNRLKGRPATQKGETSYWYGTSGIFNQMSSTWQDEQRSRSSNLRNSEIHFCSSCQKTIKTNANWYKHYRVKHNYSEEDIQKLKLNL